MSEHITHVAICDDVRRLVLCLDSISPALRHAWSEFHEASRMGGVTRKADLWSAQVVDWARTQFDAGVEPAQWRAKLAFVLGGLTHRAIDRRMKPVFKHFKQAVDARVENGKVINECTIYCDLLMLKAVFDEHKLFPLDLFGRRTARQTDAIKDAIRVVWRRVLIQMHTFSPDSDNIHTWLDELFKRSQDFNLRLDLYDQAFDNPDPDKWKKYLIDTNFYDPADPLIAAARDIQRGQRGDAKTIIDAWESTDQSNSLYAQAMRTALGYVQAASELFERQIDLGQASRRMDIGVPELSWTYQPPGG